MRSSHLRCPRTDCFGMFARAAMPVLLTACSLAAVAETPTPAAASPTASGGNELSPADRAKREADKVFQWIRIMSDKPRKTAVVPTEKPAVAAEKPVAAAPARAASVKPENKALDGAIVEKTEPIVAAQPAAPVVEAAAEPAHESPKPAQQVASVAASGTVADAPSITADEDVALVPVVKTDPEFPGSLMRSLRKGMVQVSFTVQPDGSVTQAHAVSSTHPRLVSAAVQTVSQWRFQPLHHPQEAVVDVGFNLD